MRNDLKVKTEKDFIMKGVVVNGIRRLRVFTMFTQITFTHFECRVLLNFGFIQMTSYSDFFFHHECFIDDVIELQDDS